MKKSLITIFLSTLIVSGIVYGATYTVTKDKTATIDVEGKEVLTDIPVPNKEITKTWSEERSEVFTLEQKANQLKNFKQEIERMISDYNKVVADMTEAALANSLTYEVPKVLLLTEK